MREWWHPASARRGSWRASSPDCLVAVEELVDRAVGPDVEVIDTVVAERRTVRECPMDVEREGAVHRLAVGVEASPDRELGGVGRQTRVVQRHADGGAGL